MKKIILGSTILLIICISPIKIHAKLINRLHFEISYDYSLGLSHAVAGHNLPQGYMETSGSMLHFMGIYDLNQSFSIGAGIGIDSYKSNLKTLPIFGTFRYRPFYDITVKNIYAYTNIGYGIPYNNDRSLSSGLLFNLGIGWQKMFRSHFGINAHIGYCLNQFKDHAGYSWEGYTFDQKISIWRNSLSFGFGFTF